VAAAPITATDASRDLPERSAAVFAFWSTV
jgi:hypothetical protein